MIVGTLTGPHAARPTNAVIDVATPVMGMNAARQFLDVHARITGLDRHRCSSPLNRRRFAPSISVLRAVSHSTVVRLRSSWPDSAGTHPSNPVLPQIPQIPLGHQPAQRVFRFIQAALHHGLEQPPARNSLEVVRSPGIGEEVGQDLLGRLPPRIWASDNRAPERSRVAILRPRAESLNAQQLAMSVERGARWRTRRFQRSDARLAVCARGASGSSNDWRWATGDPPRVFRRSIFSRGVRRRGVPCRRRARRA